jgi:hypothetical protein
MRWTNGTKCERSSRICPKRETRTIDLNAPTENLENTVKVYHTPDISSVPKASVLNENQAYLQSLEMDPLFRECSKKREESWEKMASRDMVGQMGQNPFFFQPGNKNSYVNDVEVRDKFLKPISTSYVE